MDSKNNSGTDNSGNCNSGNCNSGNGNSGHYNIGHLNSGSHNSGNHNSGWFNTNEPKMRFFNVESEVLFSEFANSDSAPCFDGFFITKWISELEMTDEEKKNEKDFHIRRGYLKTISYKEAWASFWSETTPENRKKFLALPNFNADIFFEITGIRVGTDSDLPKTEDKIIEIGGKKYKLTEVCE